MTYHATKHPVHNRGIPPDSFLNELIAWGKVAPDEIFVPNSAKNDIYSNVFGVLGPWESLRRRRAVMLEVMRVLAGFESSWNWNEGRDMNVTAAVSSTELEAGAWQVSANSMGWGPKLKNLVLTKAGGSDASTFRQAMKQNHPLAMEYIARLLRHTVDANGPVKRHEINPWLRKDAVMEFFDLMYPLPSSFPKVYGKGQCW